MRTGAPWRDFPPDYGDWKNTHRRFCRWRDRGVWIKLLLDQAATGPSCYWTKLINEVIDEPDLEALMIDASHIKVHPHAAGALGGNQEMAHTKGS